jgi:ABC-type spermidine/putrescine transport system permease subunit II
MVRRTVEPTVNALSVLLVLGTTVLLVVAQRWMGKPGAAHVG